MDSSCRAIDTMTLVEFFDVICSKTCCYNPCFKRTFMYILLDFEAVALIDQLEKPIQTIITDIYSRESFLSWRYSSLDRAERYSTEIINSFIAVLHVLLIFAVLFRRIDSVIE